MEKIDLVPVPDEEIVKASEFHKRLLASAAISIQATGRGYITRRFKKDAASLRRKANIDIPEVEYNIYKNDFDQFDTNGNGSLDKAELKDMLKLQSGYEPTDIQVNAMMMSMDFNDDGRVTLKEYIRAVFGG